MRRLLPLIAAAAILPACADTNTDGDTAIDTTPDNLEEGYEPPVLEEGVAPPPADGAVDTRDSDELIGEIPDDPQS